MKTSKKILAPEDWDLEYNSKGELIINDFKLTDIADQFGTPLYILNEKRLEIFVKEFKKNAEKIFNNKASVFYPFKCNSVPGIVNVVKQAGLSAEVMTECELKLALQLGFLLENIIVNGPCKTREFLLQCINNDVKFIIIDSLSELKTLSDLSNLLEKEIKLLLRVNPGFVPKGLFKGSATGSKNSSFGMNVKQFPEALSIIMKNKLLKFHGIHFHIGTGIREPKAYSSVINKLYPLFRKIESAGLKIKIVDVGGGFASMTTRELTSFEMLASQTINSYQLKFGKQDFYSTEDFLYEIKYSLQKYFRNDLPEVFFEPGRCLISSNLLLLLMVNRIKERDNKKWLITDGGLGTITMPTYYEYHEIFLCNNFNKPLKEKITITGPCCFASDIIYKNKLMPEIDEGDVLALMDTGAYFNALESSFNFPKPGIVSVNTNGVRLLRREETFTDMFSRDNFNGNEIKKENANEIFDCL